MKNKKVTAMDVARLAGVSQSSVSRAFSKNTSISSKKKQLILETAEKLGYQPNAIARGLITNQSRIIGIVMRDIENPFYPEILKLFHEMLANKGYQVMFIHSRNDEIQEDEVHHLIEYSVEGIIITDALLTSKAVEKFSRNGISVVLFNRYATHTKSNAVVCDNFVAGKEIGQYLLKKGHKHLAFISGHENTSTSIDRQLGFAESLKESGIDSFLIENGKYTYEGGFNAAKNLLAQKKRIDAIFVANDISAFGAMDYLKKQSISIPEEISVIGFDNVKMANWPSYSLTTWHQPINEMVEATIQFLFKLIDGSLDQSQIKTVEGHLVERNSVATRKNEKS